MPFLGFVYDDLKSENHHANGAYIRGWRGNAGGGGGDLLKFL